MKSMLDHLTKFFSMSPPAPPKTIAQEDPTGEDIKNRGNAFFAEGKLDAAADCYRQALELERDYAEAHNNLAHIYLQQGRDEEAESHLARAIELKPGLANAHFNLGKLFQKTGRTERALAAYDEALALSPNHPGMQFQLGEAFFSLGKIDEAISCLRLAIRLSPDDHLLHYNLAMLLLDKGEANEAIASLNRTIALAPEFVDAYLDLGSLFRGRKELVSAALYYEKAVALRPSHAGTHRHLGLVRLMQDKQDEAIACFREAVRLDPNFADAHMSLAEALQKRGKLDEALISIGLALQLAPAVPESHMVRGVTLKDCGLYAEAEQCLRHAWTLKPSDVTTFALSTILLAQRKYDEGWDLFRRRFYDADKSERRDFGHMQWAGEDIHDKGIVIWGDQGVGDEILFASLIPDVVARSRRCVVECAHKLVPLFAQSFPGAVVVPKMAPPHPATREGIDFQAAVSDTASWLRPDLPSYPRHTGYLSASPTGVARWKARLAELGSGPKIGFAWRSGLTYGQRSLHYTRLDQWDAIFSIQGMHFVNLQYGDCANELRDVGSRLGVPLHDFKEIDLFGDLAEAAALNLALDLVISAPTATAFLSAALGVPTWMMSYARPWQMLGTDHVPWFPAMRSFPRRWDQDWGVIIGEIARELESHRTKIERHHA